MQARYPAATLIILGDLGNGEREAAQAASAVSGLLAIPDFTPQEVAAFTAEHGKTPSDFNDMAQLCGPDAVNRAIAHASVPRIN